jgi:hypothetical protein
VERFWTRKGFSCMHTITFSIWDFYWCYGK